MGRNKNRNNVVAPQDKALSPEEVNQLLPQEEAPQEVTQEATPQEEAQEVPGLEEATPQEATPQEEEGEEEKAQRVEALRTRRMALLQELAQLDNQLASLQTHLLVTSKVEGPVALCRKVFVALYGDKRSKVVNTLVGKGVAPNTAKTQYQVLRKKVLDGDPTLIAEIVEAGRPLE